MRTITDREAADVAKTVVEFRVARGARFKRGAQFAVYEAVMRNRFAGLEAIYSAVINTLDGLRVSINPAWDGSIA